jgi:hypothetical protein
MVLLIWGKDQLRQIGTTGKMRFVAERQSGPLKPVIASTSRPSLQQTPPSSDLELFEPDGHVMSFARRSASSISANGGLRFSPFPAEGHSREVSFALRARCHAAKASTT